MSLKANLLKFFPIPDYLKLPSVGLDISDGDIRFVELFETMQGKKLGRYGRVSLPEGVVKNGEIADKIEFVKILKSIKKDFGTDFVRVSIIEKNSYVFRTQISKSQGMSYDDIRAQISLRLEENVPMRLDDSVFGFDIVGKKEDKIDLVVSVLPEYIVNQFLEVLGEAGLIPLTFEIESNAVARAVIDKGDKDAYMIVDYRNSRVGLSIVSDGYVQLTSTIDMGGNELINSIKRYRDVSDVEAEKIKRELGFTKGENQDLFFAMMSNLSALKDEINKYLVYWNTRKEIDKKTQPTKGIKKIILCGANGSLKGLDDYISLGVGINTESANVWRNAFELNDYIPDMHFDTSLEYAAAIGLALGAYKY